MTQEKSFRNYNCNVRRPLLPQYANANVESRENYFRQLTINLKSPSKATRSVPTPRRLFNTSSPSFGIFPYNTAQATSPILFFQPASLSPQPSPFFLPPFLSLAQNRSQNLGFVVVSLDASEPSEREREENVFAQLSPASRIRANDCAMSLSLFSQDDFSSLSRPPFTSVRTRMRMYGRTAVYFSAHRYVSRS